MIYFARVEKNGIIKIGTSKEVEKRLKFLSWELDSAMTLLAICKGSYPAEKAIHTMFATDCVGGEFFFPSEALIDFIEKIDDYQPVPEVRRPLVAVSLDERTYRRLKALADASGRSVSKQAGLLIEEALDARDRKASKK